MKQDKKDDNIKAQKAINRRKLRAMKAKNRYGE